MLELSYKSNDLKLLFDVQWTIVSVQEGKSVSIYKVLGLTKSSVSDSVTTLITITSHLRTYEFNIAGHLNSHNNLKKTREKTGLSILYVVGKLK